MLALKVDCRNRRLDVFPSTCFYVNFQFLHKVKWSGNTRHLNIKFKYWKICNQLWLNRFFKNGPTRATGWFLHVNTNQTLISYCHHVFHMVSCLRFHCRSFYYVTQLWISTLYSRYSCIGKVPTCFECRQCNSQIPKPTLQLTQSAGPKDTSEIYSHQDKKTSFLLFGC